MTRDELEVQCIKWMHWMLEGNTDKADMILNRIFAALTGKRPNCLEMGQGHGLCDMCAGGEPKLCRYVNTIASMEEIDRLRSALSTDQPEGPGTYLLTVEAEVNPGGMFSICNSPWDDWWSIECITGTWRKVEP